MCEYVLGNGVNMLKCSLVNKKGKPGICAYQSYCGCNGRYNIAAESDMCKLKLAKEEELEKARIAEAEAAARKKRFTKERQEHLDSKKEERNDIATPQEDAIPEQSKPMSEDID